MCYFAGELNRNISQAAFVDNCGYNIPDGQNCEVFYIGISSAKYNHSHYHVSDERSSSEYHMQWHRYFKI